MGGIQAIRTVAAGARQAGRLAAQAAPAAAGAGAAAASAATVGIPLAKLPVLTAKQAVKLLTSNEFSLVRTKGSHATYAHANGRQTTVAMHGGDMPRGTLRAIMQQAGLGVEALGRR